MQFYYAPDFLCVNTEIIMCNDVTQSLDIFQSISLLACLNSSEMRSIISPMTTKFMHTASKLFWSAKKSSALENDREKSTIFSAASRMHWEKIKRPGVGFFPHPEPQFYECSMNVT